MGDEKIAVGSLVRVAYPTDGQFANDPARKYDGKEFVVKRKKFITGGRYPRWYFELYGAESNKGVPYGFCEEDLIKI